MILSVKPLGPLHLSLRQIPSPAMRAFYEQETISVPLPSTIMGALGSALGIRLSGRDDGMFGLHELRSRLAERFGGQFRIWGPLIKLAGREYLYIPVAEGLCPLGEARKYIEYTLDRYKGIKREGAPVEPAWTMSKIGIRIAPERRTAEEGFMYLNVYAAASGKAPVEYLYELTGIGSYSMKAAVRLGGESRLAYISLGNGNLPLERRRASIHILLSPCVLPFANAAQGSVNIIKTINGTRARRIYGKVSLLGLGFSEALGRRRPLRPQLMQGAVIEFEGEEDSMSWVGELTELGYGASLGVM
jgi:hypothetical protein